MTEIKFSKVSNNEKKTKEATRLKDIYLRLHADRKVKSQADFGRQIGFTSPAVTQMMTGEKPLPFRMVRLLLKNFGVNANYVIADDETFPFYVSELYSIDKSQAKSREEALKLQIVGYEKEILDLKQRVQDKEKIIQLLERSKS